MNKIMITGNAGSGKTSLSRQIAMMLNRPDVINLDKIIWKSGWIGASKEDIATQYSDIAMKSNWIVDGVSTTLLEASDTIIFLDYPRSTCYLRAFFRNCKYLFKSRPELPERCPEVLMIWQLIKIIWKFHHDVRPAILNHIKAHSCHKKIFHITNNNELLSVIKTLNDFITVQ